MLDQLTVLFLWGKQIFRFKRFSILIFLICSCSIFTFLYKLTLSLAIISNLNLITISIYILQHLYFLFLLCLSFKRSRKAKGSRLLKNFSFFWVTELIWGCLSWSLRRNFVCIAKKIVLLSKQLVKTFKAFPNKLIYNDY